VFYGSHVIVIDGLLSHAITVYRTAEGHAVQAGCQNFQLTDDLADIASSNEEALPPGWRHLREALLAQVATWH
jgi:hypothetical protein